MLRSVLQHADRVDQVFRALADPTRRQVIERLVSGPASTSELARPFAMALPSFTQHLAVLEGAGLVASEKHGRTRTYRLAPSGLDDATWARAKGWTIEQTVAFIPYYEHSMPGAVAATRRRLHALLTEP